jgi:hypothetical protein
MEELLSIQGIEKLEMLSVLFPATQKCGLGKIRKKTTQQNNTS